MVGIAQHGAYGAAKQAVVAARASHAPAQSFVGVALEQAVEGARKAAETTKHGCLQFW